MAMNDNVILIILCVIGFFGLLGLNDFLFGSRKKNELPDKPEFLTGKDKR